MRNTRGSASHLWLVAAVCTVTVGFQVAAAGAQGVGAMAAVGPQAQASSSGATPSATRRDIKASEKYFIEFRARLALSYGHTFVVFGKGAAPGKTISPDQVAGLHPFTNSSIPWIIGHVVPVPSETGASVGDTDEIYVSARYRVVLNKAEYDRVVGYIKELQASKRMWQAEAYNCNDFVADIARFMGLKVPSTMQFSKEFVNGLRDLNSPPRAAAAASAVAAH
jgi:hypothetical protein